MYALKIIGIIIGIFIAIIALGLWYASIQIRPSKLAAFIRDNPDKASIYLMQNDSVLADVNSGRVMPLASTVKIIIAIEYAHQAATGRISPDEMIDTAEPGKYYIPNTDGGAHPMWLKSMTEKKLVSNGKVRLEEIAKGMMVYSSNANTEYLMEKLGLDRINGNLAKLGLAQHQLLYPLASVLLVCNGKTEGQLQQMPLAEYIDSSYAIHKRLQANETAIKDHVKQMPRGVQKIISDRLPCGTAKEYVSIMKKINSRTYFDSATQKNLEILMEGLMENPKNRTWLAHAGMKGGSTAFVLTKALYATTIKGDKTELAYFLNNLTFTQKMFLHAAMNEFELNILADKEKRNELLAIINSPRP